MSDIHLQSFRRASRIVNCLNSLQIITKMQEKRVDIFQIPELFFQYPKKPSIPNECVPYFAILSQSFHLEVRRLLTFLFGANCILCSTEVFYYSSRLLILHPTMCPMKHTTPINTELVSLLHELTYYQ